MKSWCYGCLLVCLICSLIAGCGKSGDEPDISDQELAEELASLDSKELGTPETSLFPKDVVAIVNEQFIMRQELAERFREAVKQLDLSSPPDVYTLNRLREEALTELIEKVLIAQKAREQNVTVSEEAFQHVVQQIQVEYNGTDIHTILQQQGESYEAWERAQRESLLLDKLLDLNMESMIAVSDQEVQQHYERNKEKYDYPAQVRASQILTYEQTTAEKALQEIRGGADFAQVAQKYSESDDAQNGGDLGFFEQGVMPPEFDEVIFSLNMGAVSNVIKTPYGFQIFKLTGQREAHRESFEEVKEQIRMMLKKQKRAFAFDFWIAELRDNSKILFNQELIKQIK